MDPSRSGKPPSPGGFPGGNPPSPGREDPTRIGVTLHMRGYRTAGCKSPPLSVRAVGGLEPCAIVPCPAQAVETVRLLVDGCDSVLLVCSTHAEWLGRCMGSTRPPRRTGLVQKNDSGDAPRSFEEVVAALAVANPGRRIIDCPGCGLIFAGPPAVQVHAVQCHECGHTAEDVSQVTVNRSGSS